MSDPIIITVELTKREAAALAQFVKRASFATCERLSDPTNKEEPYQMMEGINAIQRGLAEKGFSPR